MTTSIPMPSCQVRRPRLCVASAVLVAVWGCAPRGVARPDTPAAPPREARLQTSAVLGCPARLLVSDRGTGAALEPIATTEDGRRLAPPKSLQSSYEDYLHRRGANADRVTVEPAPEPSSFATSYWLPVGLHHLRVADDTRSGVGPVPYGGGAGIVVVVLVFLVVDALLRPAPVDIDVEIEPEGVYLLHCDARRDPWAWVTQEIAPQ